MSPEYLTYTALALAILGTHLASLRFLAIANGSIILNARNYADSLTAIQGSMAEANEAMMEVVKIGSDVADQMDNLSLGSGMASGPTLSPPMDIQSTIIGLIADKFLAGSDGSKTQQERDLFQENDQTPESISE